MFPMKNVEASCEDNFCASPFGQCGAGCFCIPEAGCIPGLHKDAVKKIGEHPNLCESHVECKKKGSGSFCARFPNLDVDYGWCFASKSEAEDIFSKSTTESKFTKDFLKMSVSA